MFDALFNRAADAILLTDDEGRYIRTNRAAEQLTKYSNAELLTMTVFDLTPTANKSAGLALWRDFIRLGTLSGEYKLQCKDGAQVDVEFQAVANIRPGVHLSIVRDVTARVQSERELRRAMSLQEATAAMNAAVDTSEVAKVILSAGLTALDAQAGHVVVVGDDGRWAEVVATMGLPPNCLDAWAEVFRRRGAPPTTVNNRCRFALDESSLLIRTFRKGSAQIQQVADLAVGAQFNLAALGTAMITLPLVVNGVLVGGLFLFWEKKLALSEHELPFATTLAALCAQALERARLFSAERAAREKAVASEKHVLQYQRRLQRMAFDRAVVAESERRLVATALHDGVSQYLALAEITLKPVARRLEGADQAALEAALKLLSSAIEETRSLSFELSPPVLYDLGIRAALSWLGEQLQRTTGIRIDIVDDGSDPILDDVTAPIVYRTVRELLMNAVKHAHSATARVYIRQHAEHVQIIVEDGGVGFDAADTSSQAGFGLMSVREHIGRLGGSVEITSAPGKGARVTVSVPLSHSGPASEQLEAGA
jgi:PAS domain S-box-containing protein